MGDCLIHLLMVSSHFSWLVVMVNWDVSSNTENSTAIGVMGCGGPSQNENPQCMGRCFLAHPKKCRGKKKQIMWKKKSKLRQRGLGSVPKRNTPFHPWFSHIGVHQIAKSPLVYHVNFPCKLPFRVPFHPYSDTKSAPFDDLAVGELPGVFSLGVSAGPAVTLGHIINGKCGNEMGIITMFDC